MIYIFAYKLKRKNARRKIYVKKEFNSQYEAISRFNNYCKARNELDGSKMQWELLTGDWKHICYYEEKEGEKDGQMF